MLLRARDNNIQSFAFIWLDKGNQYEFLKHPKIKSGVPKNEVGGSSPLSNYLIFGCFRKFVLISFIKPDERKTLNILDQ